MGGDNRTICEFTCLFVWIFDIFVQKTKFFKVILTKFLAFVIRILQVLLGVKKSQNVRNGGGADSVSPRVGEALNGLLHNIDISIILEKKSITYLMTDRAG